MHPDIVSGTPATAASDDSNQQKTKSESKSEESETKPETENVEITANKEVPKEKIPVRKVCTDVQSGHISNYEHNFNK